MTKPLAPDMETLKEWSAQLGIPFEKVLKKAGVTDPAKGARATRMRMRRGGAPRARQQLLAVLLEYERQSDRPTEIGAVVAGLEEWHALGAELAELERETFFKLLEAARKRVARARTSAEDEKPFFDEDE